MKEEVSARERELVEQIEELRRRLEEPESTLRAIRDGEVDAFFMSGRAGDRVYTLFPADPPYRRIVDEMKEGAATLSPQGTILYANRRLGELLEIAPERLRGTSIREWMQPGSLAAFDALLARHEGGRCEIDFRASGGTVFTASLAASVFRNDDVTAFSVIVTDLTEQKASMELAAAAKVWKEADRRKDEFLATLGHELRTPLAALNRAAEIIDRSSPSDVERLRWAGDVVRRQVGNMARLVDDLLDISRIATGKMAIRKETVDLAMLVPAIVSPLAPGFAEKGRSLSLSTPDDPVLVDADAMRFAQIVSNLLQNAIKFTRPDGHVWVTLSKSGGRAVLNVRDDGQGIPPHMLGRVFDLFEQGERIAPPSESGLGIGLTLVRHLVELHGGTVSVESGGPGQGASFTVSLPLSLSSRPVAEPAPPVPEPSASPRRILIVEDNTDLAEGLAMLLRLDGHSVETAADGLAAIARCSELRPDVVLLDLGLPDMDGFETARRLRPMLAPSALLVALTGYGKEDERVRSEKADFDRHVVKPVGFDELRRILAEVDLRELH
ncbi:MAG TPA: ATP-binding protein [Thermoanaerobaculia bacterium]|nr:ATP-binding protein [Thermoanaerobaculia bacterium]